MRYGGCDGSTGTDSLGSGIVPWGAFDLSLRAGAKRHMASRPLGGRPWEPGVEGPGAAHAATSQQVREGGAGAR